MIEENVEMRYSILNTDRNTTYPKFGRAILGRGVVAHESGQ